jgi:hypothetical protein
MKHIDIDLHFVHDRVALGDAKVVHVFRNSQFADIFTKGFPTVVFREFQTSLNIVHCHSSTVGGVEPYVPFW